MVSILLDPNRAHTRIEDAHNHVPPLPIARRVHDLEWLLVVMSLDQNRACTHAEHQHHVVRPDLV